MYEIDDELYARSAEQLLDTLGRESYHTDTLTFCYDGVQCTFKFTVVIYRERVECPDESFMVITDLVPVWWEFLTTINGEEMLNEFDFERICDIVCP